MLITNSKGENAKAVYSLENKNIELEEESGLSPLLHRNIPQLRKILINKKEESFFKGFELQFVLIENKPITNFEDRNKTIVLDRRGGKYFFDVLDKSCEQIIEAFTDGSYSSKTRKGGYVVLLKDLKGDYTLKKYKSKIHKSSLLELLAAIKAMELLKSESKFRIITDSVYVVKGISEWLPIWKMNNWCTCNGEAVKNIYHWKRVDALTENKYIEFQWVKGHSGHFENSICDLYAKEMAGQK